LATEGFDEYLFSIAGDEGDVFRELVFSALLEFTSTAILDTALSTFNFVIGVVS